MGEGKRVKDRTLCNSKCKGWARKDRSTGRETRELEEHQENVILFMLKEKAFFKGG